VQSASAAGLEVSGSADVISNTRAFSASRQSGKEYGAGSGNVKSRLRRADDHDQLESVRHLVGEAAALHTVYVYV